MTMTQRVALVTGTGGELGAAIAAALAASGAMVVGLDIADTATDLTARHYRCDLSDLAAVGEVLDSIRREVGPIEVLVNNAAYYRHTPFFELTPEQIRTTLAVNVTAVLFLCQQVARQIIQSGSGGVIVNVASIAGRNGSSQVDYGASKAAVINLTATLGRVLAEHGIRINGVAPALVGSGMGTRLGPGVREKFLAATPLKRAAEPAEVADVVAFLASDAASYLNGTTIDIHGGL
ncbi:SDR family NAD(P)-dependent oxidoreductase [Aromatoleum toluclasticum]|uniref:SDR family NAD(P)-dependent oxidoreductase n=1 Tax=Aromatoleum toluclasticum TaxID=92003 RepID=UPI001D18AC15|nr:SDR family oxidoreductase [Aromatoleum toluclasticum]